MKRTKYKIKDLFEISYGEREIHDKSNLVNGEELVISSQGTNNGSYGFYKKDPKFKNFVITVPSTGSVGIAYVQEFNCSIDDNCLVLTPKKSFDYDIVTLYFIAVMIRAESWRFQYGRQVTPLRIGKLLIDFTKFNHTKIKKFRDLQEKYLF